jgi:hypothetical protein
VEAQATLAEREARERVIKAEVESITSLAFVRGEAYCDVPPLSKDG